MSLITAKTINFNLDQEKLSASFEEATGGSVIMRDF